MPDSSTSQIGYSNGGMSYGGQVSGFSQGATTATPSSKTAYASGYIANQSTQHAYAGGTGGNTSQQNAYLSGVSGSRISAFAQGTNEGGPPEGGGMASAFIWLKTSDGTTISKKFRVIAEGYDDGTPDKSVSMEKTIGGGLDISQGAVYRSWSPVIRVRHTETETDYGNLQDLEDLYALNDPGGTPSNIVTFTDHHDTTHYVMLVGEFRKQLLSAMIEGQYAWYLVRLRMMEVQ